MSTIDVYEESAAKSLSAARHHSLTAEDEHRLSTQDQIALAQANATVALATATLMQVEAQRDMHRATGVLIDTLTDINRALHATR